MDEDPNLLRLLGEHRAGTLDLGELTRFLLGAAESLERFRDVRLTALIGDGLSIHDPGAASVDPHRRAAVNQFLKTAVPHCRKRLADLEKDLNGQFVGKEEVVRVLMIGAVAQQPVLILGDPGTAKSAVAQRMCDGLGVQRAGDPERGHACFKYLLHAFTEPDEILGVLNIKRLIEDHVFERHRAGSITEAVVVVLDEVFRANSSLLNALLSIIHERRVYEGGHAIRTLARMIVGLSNQLPAGRQLEDLRAFVERFVLRVVSEPVPLPIGPADGGAAARQRLLRAAWGQEAREQRAGYDPARTAAPQSACLNDVLVCNRAAVEWWGGEDLGDPQIKDFVALYHGAAASLGGGRAPVCPIDDRKFVKLFMAARAHAVLRGEGPPAASDLTVLGHAWDDSARAEHVRGRVRQFINDHSGGRK